MKFADRIRLNEERPVGRWLVLVMMIPLMWMGASGSAFSIMSLFVVFCLFYVCNVDLRTYQCFGLSKSQFMRDFWAAGAILVACVVAMAWVIGLLVRGGIGGLTAPVFMGKQVEGSLGMNVLGWFVASVLMLGLVFVVNVKARRL